MLFILDEARRRPEIGRGQIKFSKWENLKAFVADIAVKTGKGRSTVARDVTRAKKVAVLDDIAGTCLDKGDEIDALGKPKAAAQARDCSQGWRESKCQGPQARQKGADPAVGTTTANSTPTRRPAWSGASEHTRQTSPSAKR